MKRLLVQILCFLMPFIILTALYDSLYSKSGGDLTRLSKISYPENYRDQFTIDFQQKKTYVDLSEINLHTPHSFDLLTIGDSFSDQGVIGYQNYLNSDYDISVLNFDFLNFYRYENYNPVRFLKSILTDSIFGRIKIDYIILEVAERNFISRQFNSEPDSNLSLIDLVGMKREIPEIDNNKGRISTYLSDVRRFYAYNTGYLFNNLPFDSKVYKMKLSKPMFSVNESDLLFFYQDIKNMKVINKDNIYNLNADLNNLAERLKQFDIQLIVMPCVDKYDLYYEYILDNRFRKNLFFEYLKNEKKEYIYIDTKLILNQYLEKGEKDLFFADDSHWSPKATKIVASQIKSLIQNN